MTLDKLDKDLLLAYLLGVDRVYLRTHHPMTLTSEQQAQYDALLARRAAGEPLAYIIGKKEFWSLELEVTPDTLIPRPDTEILVETVLQLCQERRAKIADMGTGSGAIALALAKERPQWQIYATDVSENALQVASKNAQRFKLANISFYQGNWCTALPCKDFHVIAANPPYISEQEWPMYAEGLQHEPYNALVADDNGMAALMLIAQTAREYLKPGGYLVMEHGFAQAAAVQEVLAKNGYSNIGSVEDLSGNQRVSYGQSLN